MTEYEINSKEYEVDYDLDNRIIKVDVNNSDVEYRYDALGRRTIRKEGSTQTTLLWWGDSECAEYVHGAGQATIQNDIMSHPTALNAVIARAVDGSKFDLEWYHKNYLDHVYAVSDDSGDLNEHYRYTAFGEVTIYNGAGAIQITSQINNSILWNTRRLDTVSNYYLYKYRHYDPTLGRWPGRDPIEEDGGVNLYAFGGNDAVNSWDYLGWKKVIIKVPVPKRPSLEDLNKDYDGWDSGKSTKDIWDDAGGKCEGLNDGYRKENKGEDMDTCALRMSQAFNESGNIIAKMNGIRWGEFTDGNNRNNIISAREFATYLEAQWGTPIENKKGNDIGLVTKDKCAIVIRFWKGTKKGDMGIRARHISFIKNGKPFRDNGERMDYEAKIWIIPCKSKKVACCCDEKTGEYALVIY